MDTSPEEASTSKKGWPGKGVFDVYISRTVHHSMRVRRTLNESTFPWLSAVLYFGRFGTVLLANGAKKKVLFPPLFLPSRPPL